MIRRLLGTLGICLGVAVAAGVQAADPVRIGFALAKTGLFAAAADAQIKTYELWKDEVNARGGLDVKGIKRPIEFVFYDDQSDPGKTVQMYEKLITGDRVDLLLAPYGTPSHLAVAGVIERHQFPLVGNTAASVKLREIKPGNMWFTTGEMPDRLAKSLTDLMVAKGIKSIALLVNQLPFPLESKSFLVPALKQAGIEIKVNEEYPPNIKDMTSILRAVKAANPDAVIAFSFPADSALYIKQAREMNITAKLQFLEVGPTEYAFRKQFGNTLNGVISMGHWVPERAEFKGAKRYLDAYVQRYNEPPSYLNGPLAFMSCQIIEQAVAKAGLDRNAIRAAIVSETFDTVNGPVKFNGVENVGTPAGLIQVQGEKMQLIWPASIATAEFMPKPAWPSN
jgi:branched-chain amino acid transport system substrate-binding protein